MARKEPSTLKHILSAKAEVKMKTAILLNLKNSTCLRLVAYSVSGCPLSKGHGGLHKAPTMEEREGERLRGDGAR